MTAVALHVPDQTGYNTSRKVAAWVEANDRFRRDIVADLRDAGPRSRAICQNQSGPMGLKRLDGQPQRHPDARAALRQRGGRDRRTRRMATTVGRAERATHLSSAFLPPRQSGSERSDDSGRSASPAPRRPSCPASRSQLETPGSRADRGIGWRTASRPNALDRPFTGRTACLSPFDRLVHDRDRTISLFDFEHTLRWTSRVRSAAGTLPCPRFATIRLVGKLDARADRNAGTLTVNALHEDVASPERCARRGDRDRLLAAWLGPGSPARNVKCF